MIKNRDARVLGWSALPQLGAWGNLVSKYDHFVIAFWKNGKGAFSWYNFKSETHSLFKIHPS
ncbi:MAG: hypothetical protein DRI32_07815 [Chloroflexi bacterium]|nr:MAG: hypothetical protein DRI32_07815 [Chloroflexota bacterium]